MKKEMHDGMFVKRNWGVTCMKMKLGRTVRQ